VSARPADTRNRRTAPNARSARPPRATRASNRARGRRRGLGLLITLLVSAALAAIVLPNVHDAVKEITLPLKHEDIIRQQAKDKGLDPALIAAVIYAESHFRDGQESSAGALGLMQLTPETAKDIARKSGGSGFGIKDLGSPQVNISYGAYYLRYLKQRFAGNTALMLAAYNAGEGNVDKWIGEAASRERDFRVQDIPFPETRAYVEKVLDAARDYRANYASELGLG
jgi:soluble lytic murein transglycosylase